MTLVVNSAATVTFDERLDEAVAANTLGRKPPVEVRALRQRSVHARFDLLRLGVRKGVVVEDFSARSRRGPFRGEG